MTAKKRGDNDVSILGTRADKKVDCYPAVSTLLIDQIGLIADVIGETRTKVAGDLAHLALYNERVLMQVRPYFHFPLLITWNTGSLSNVFYISHPSTEVSDLRPLIQAARGDEPSRLKFRISQSDRRRLQGLMYACNLSTADALWPILLGLVVLEPRVVSLITGSNEVALCGRHPLTGDYIETSTHHQGVIRL